MPSARVVSVAPGTAGADAGIVPGDEILTLNGSELRDVIEYQMQADESRVEIELRRGGLDRLVAVDKPVGAPLGLELESAVFDRVRTCDNHCPFCFIYQLPKGMRRSLYLKDDDYRLSFLYGNFTTLTRFTEADLERILDERLSPLYVSIHATDPEVRTRLLRNRRGATSLRWLEALLDARIETHGQVVVCPGINDGEVLDETLLGILDRFPGLETIGVVPLGVSAHSNEPDMRYHTRAEAAAVVDCVEAWQQRFLDALGRRAVFASDEYYLLAARELPPLDCYEGVAQHENGIGMARTFEAEVAATIGGRDVQSTTTREGFFAWVEGADQSNPGSGQWTGVEGAPAEGYRAQRHDGAADDVVRHDRPVTVVTGELGAEALRPLLPTLRERARGPVELLPIENRFFGGNIGVTGLLTAGDVSAAIADVPAAHRVLIPDVVLSRDQFLDGGTLDDLPRPVEVVPTNGRALVLALT